MNNEVERYEGELRTLREKVAVYEDLLHSLQMYAAVTLDQAAIAHALSIICDWSYAHRQGNGELTEEQQDNLVRKHFDRLKNGEFRQSVWNSGVDTQFKQAGKLSKNVAKKKKR
jgi:Tfp pilus assembly protein PilN